MKAPSVVELATDWTTPDEAEYQSHLVPLRTLYQISPETSDCVFIAGVADTVTAPSGILAADPPS